MILNLQQLLQPAVRGATNAANGMTSAALRVALTGAHQAGSQALQTKKLLPQTVGFAPPPIAPLAPAAPVDYNALQSYYADPSHSDYHNDPVLLQVQAQEARDNANAEAGGLAGRRQLLQQLGDPSLALAVLGKDDPTLGTISDSPDSPSALGRLARGYHDTVESNEDARNKANLWYSSARGEGLRNDAQDYSTEQHDTVAAAQQALDQITQQIAQSKTSSHDRSASAENDAYQRYLNAIMKAPPGALPGPGSSSSGDGGSSGAPTNPVVFSSSGAGGVLNGAPANYQAGRNNVDPLGSFLTPAKQPKVQQPRYADPYAGQRARNAY